jgi:uncharacterized RDD family membrane protein YckC
MSEGHNPYAPPLAEVKDAPQTGQELAGRGTRLLAIIVDVIVQMGLLFVLNLVLPWKVFATDPSLGLMVANGVLGGVLFLAVQGWLLVKRGQTVGKIALNVRIVRKDGSAVGAGRLLGLRYGVGFVLGVIPVIGMIYALVDCLLIFRGSRQCLHDQIADTIVVRA